MKRALIVLAMLAGSAQAQDIVWRPAPGGGAATSVEPGVTTFTGCTDQVAYGDGSAILNCEAALGYDEATDTFSVVNVTASGVVKAAAGSVGATALNFGTAGTGYFSQSANVLNASINGVAQYYLGSGLFRFISSLELAWASGDPTATASDVGLRRHAAGVVRVAGTTNITRGLLGGGAAVASATAMPLPTGRVLHVTGTTTVTSITSTNFQAGVCITIIFDDALTFTNGSNLVLAGDFVTTANDTISLCYDGSAWVETGRSVN
jgi:hypothetical protein